MKKEAMIVMATCHKSKEPFGIRTEKKDGAYIMDWAFAVDSKAAKKEGFENNRFSGTVNFSEEYPGCPYCGAMAWFQCSNCQRIVCWNEKDETVTCPECGNSGYLEAATEFDLSGGGL